MRLRFTLRQAPREIPSPCCSERRIRCASPSRKRWKPQFRPWRLLSHDASPLSPGNRASLRGHGGRGMFRAPHRADKPEIYCRDNSPGADFGGLLARTPGPGIFFRPWTKGEISMDDYDLTCVRKIIMGGPAGSREPGPEAQGIFPRHGVRHGIWPQ